MSRPKEAGEPDFSFSINATPMVAGPLMAKLSTATAVTREVSATSLRTYPEPSTMDWTTLFG
jgi:hypothetical protein